MKNILHNVMLLITLSLFTKIGHKREQASDTLKCLSEYQADISIAKLQNYANLISEIEHIKDNVGVVLLNQHALNITSNWLCNLNAFDDPNILSNIVIFAMDTKTYFTLKHNWPAMKVLMLDLPAVSQPFRVGHCQYQLFQLLRANLATIFSMLNKSFWMLQPDTYWRENLFDLFDFSHNDTTDVYLDVEGESVLSSKMIAGGNFYVRASKSSSMFFHQLGSQIKERYTTDNNIMGALCSTGYASIQCEYIPYHTISNWRWRNYNIKPSLMQFDSLILPGTLSKLERMYQAGAKFSHPDGTCVSLASSNLSTLVSFDDSLQLVLLPSYFNVFQLAHGVCESICHFFPSIVDFLLGTVFPNYAYFLI